MNYEITDFQTDVIKRSSKIPVLVDFWAEWCGPCKMLGPVLERLAEKNGSQWVLAKVNTDAHQDIASQYGIRGIPSVKLFVDGRVANEFTGALPEHAVVQWLNKALPNKFRKRIEEAQLLLGNGKTPEGQSILRDVIHQDPGNHLARVLLAESLISSEPEEAVGLVADIEEDSEHYPMVESIRTFAELSSKALHPERLPDDPVKDSYVAGLKALASMNYKLALRKFIEVIRTNRYYDEDGARMACIAIFRLLGEDHEITQAYRREFSSALYS
jgi:putative thioredoxin